jgi:hypothetical protein
MRFDVYGCAPSHFLQSGFLLAAPAVWILSVRSETNEPASQTDDRLGGAPGRTEPFCPTWDTWSRSQFSSMRSLAKFGTSFSNGSCAVKEKDVG